MNTIPALSLRCSCETVIRGGGESGDDPGHAHRGGKDCPKHGDTTAEDDPTTEAPSEDS